MRMFKTIRNILFITAMLSAGVAAQSTEFTYQGQLQASSTPGNGSFDFEFALFDAVSGGTQIGSTLTRSGVAVANGIFSVSLDFGSGFPGAGRFLEIRVRQSGGGGFTTLSPRQPVTSSPYAIKSITSESATVATNAITANNATTANNALQLGGVAANQYVQTGDSRLTDARPPTPGSGDYIQNSTTAQAASNFNITGTGTGSTLNALTQYNINGNRVLSVAGSGNIYVGVGSGQANPTGFSNTFFGSDAGKAHTTGFRNTFIGTTAGLSNTTGNNNTFIGERTGLVNTTGGNNTFVGIGAGSSNTISFLNTFVGANAGASNTTGDDNAFFGESAGVANMTGSRNTFVGSQSGRATAAGFDNVFVGNDAGRSNTTGSGNAFFGSEAGSGNTDGESNTFVGVFAGNANTVGDGNAFFGRDAGGSNTSGGGNAFLGRNAGAANTTGASNTAVGSNANVGAGNLNFATAIGAGSLVSDNNSIVLGRTADTVRVPGTLRVTGGTDAEPGSGGYMIVGVSPLFANVVIDDNEIMARNGGGTETLFLNADGGDVNLISTGTGNVGIGIATTPQDKLHVDGIIRVTGLGAAGATSLCRNASLQISTCSSSLRYKTNIDRFGLGLNLINQLKPITFDWKDGGMHDLGLGAEDVAAIEPLLVTYNKNGEVEGVKYDRIGVVLVNAVKEQQAQIESQRSEIGDLKAQINALKELVCRQDRESAMVCRNR